MRGAEYAAESDRLGELLREMVERGASDLHLTPGRAPTLRVDGALTTSRDDSALEAGHTLGLVRSVLTSLQRRRFEDDGELDFAFEVPDLARFRGACYRQRGECAVALRHIPTRPPTFEELALPPALGRLAERSRGMVLVTGPTGSGKSTTLAALVDVINRRMRGHILTVEDPIEFLHRSRRCLVSQREIGTDAESFSSALRHALRQDPDVILVGEMRDLETIAAALTIAETGHLVLSTLHTNSAVDTVSRIVDAFPAEQQRRVRSQLASVLEGVATQILVPRESGGGRVAAVEVLVCTGAVRAVIRDDRSHQLRSLMQAGRRHGMQTLNDDLARLYLEGRITLGAALGRSPDPAELRRRTGESAAEPESAGGDRGGGG